MWETDCCARWDDGDDVMMMMMMMVMMMAATRNVPTYIHRSKATEKECNGLTIAQVIESEELDLETYCVERIEKLGR